MAASLGSGDFRVVDMERLTGGSQASTHAIQLHPLGWVVLKRWPAARPDPARVEFARLVAADRTGLVVPRPLAADPGGDWFGQPALVMTRVDGQPRLHAHPGPWLSTAADVLATIHGSDVTAATDPVLHAPHGALHWVPLPPERFPRTNHVQRLLAAAADLQRDFHPEAEPSVLLHHDFRQNNLLWSNDRISGVIDWHDARLGPAASDVAYFSVDIVRTNGLEAVEQFVSAYEARRGPVDDLARWQALWIASQLPWMHRWKTADVPGAQQVTREAAQDRVDALTTSVLANL